MGSTSKFGAIEYDFGIEDELVGDDTVQTPVSGVHRRSSQENTRVVANAFDPRIAAVRELYEQDEVDAALLIASSMVSDAAAAAHNSNAPRDVRDPNGDPNATGGYSAVFAADDVLAKVSGLRGVPRVCASAETLRALPFDARQGFLLSLMDGTWSIRDLCDLSSMSEDEMVRTLSELAEHGVITFA